MIKTGTRGFGWRAAVLSTALLVFFGFSGCENATAGNSPEEDPGPPPVGISGFPETLTMGVPLDLRKTIRVNLPDAPDKTVDDIIWAKNTSGAAFASTQIVLEDDLLIPVTYLDSVTVYAIVRDGEGEGFDYVETFETSIQFPLNPFIGVWSGSDGRTWEFRTDGTYGIGEVEDVGSFVVWSGKPGRKFLVAVAGDPETISVENVAAMGYKTYCFEQNGNTIKITPIAFNYAATNKQDPSPFVELVNEVPITFTRQSGEPAAFDLSQNPTSAAMIGGWSGGFNSAPFDPETGTISIGASPGITYYADGRVPYMYEGAWLKRGKVFVTIGNDGRRWDPPALASWDTVTAAAMGNKEVVLITEYRPGGSGTPYSRGTNGSLHWRLVRWSPPEAE
jgi:hypothetical protein